MAWLGVLQPTKHGFTKDTDIHHKVTSLITSINVVITRVITSMNNSRASTDAQSHNLLKLTNQIRAGLNWTNRKFVVVERGY